MLSSPSCANRGVQKFVDVAAMECLCDMPVVKQPVRPSPPNCYYYYCCYC